MKLKVRDMRINVVSKSSEKYMEIRFGSLFSETAFCLSKLGWKK